MKKITALFVIVAALFIGGCAVGTYHKTAPNGDVTDMKGVFFPGVGGVNSSGAVVMPPPVYYYAPRPFYGRQPTYRYYPRCR